MNPPSLKNHHHNQKQKAEHLLRRNMIVANSDFNQLTQVTHMLTDYHQYPIIYLTGE